jgi:hypothetical protein
MSQPHAPDNDSERAAERALSEVERLGREDGEDHAGRLDALERLHGELEAELEERDSESRSDQ